MHTLRGFVSVVALGFALFLGACGSPAPSGDGVDHVSNELTGGCRWDCPKCPPNQVCSMLACREICPGKKTCDVMAKCAAGYSWSDKLCNCVRDRKATASCTTNEDCRLFSDYCTGCDCRALSQNDADPTCDGPGVRCFADPYGTSTATCVNGTCSLQ